MSADATVFWMTERMGDVPRHNRWLSPRERDTLASKRILKRRAEWRLGRWTVKRALHARLAGSLAVRRLDDIEVRASGDGAPVAFVRGRVAPVAVSISHSHGVGMCAMARPEIGIGCDAEWIEPRGEEFVWDYFSPEERDAIDRVGPSGRSAMVTLLWSAKESVLKALREGLRRDPRGVLVALEGPRDEKGWCGFAAHTLDTGEPFRGWWRVAGGHVYTMALRAPREASDRCSR